MSVRRKKKKSQPTSSSPANCGSLTSDPLLTFPLWAHGRALCLLSESAGRRHFKPHHSKTNMLKPAEMQTVNKSDCRPRLDGSEATVCHPALTFALWEVHAEAAAALRLSQTSHLRERNCWKGGSANPGGAQTVWVSSLFLFSWFPVWHGLILCSVHSQSQDYGETSNSISSEKSLII